MEQYPLAHPDPKSRLLPTPYRFRPDIIPTRREKKPTGLVAWVQNHPAARVGVAVLALAAGALLSEQVMTRRRKVDIPVKVCELEPQETILVSLVRQPVIFCQRITVWYLYR